ncbi:hypothetical protein BGY98DRAFT_945175 [Russula aff. rugulosa BPL654]|nr:hypothetical protein BGY98DRAFT_945175 [Russula aff. rugulosa BPL654]
MEQPNSLITNTRTRSSQSGEIGPSGVSSQVEISAPPRKKRVRRPTNDSADFGSRSSPTKKPSRNSSGPSRSKSSSVPALDPAADPGEDLDPTVITMAAICEDTGQGRVSSKASQILDNHAAWKRSNKDKRTRMRALMDAKKYGRTEDVDDRTTTSAETLDRPASSSSGTPAPSVVPETRFGFDYDNTMATSRFNVQVRIGPNGETIVDEESLFVDRAEEHETDNYVHVEESDATKFVNSGSYSKKFRGTRWTAEETELFYAALSQFGENYELMSYVLPGRDRKACKAKFKTEDKKNSQRINHCLKNRVPYDMQTLSRMTGKDFSGPVPVIRAKPPPNLEPSNPDTESASIAARKQSRTPGPTRPGVEAEPGHTSSTRPGIKAAPSVAPQKAKKSANDMSQDDVEVLGTIDGDWD